MSGHSFELFADFTQAGNAYLAFPDPRTFRIRLDDLRDEKVRDRLRRIWPDPLALDPAKQSADVTREVAGYLAELAKSLEKAGHAAPSSPSSSPAASSACSPRTSAAARKDSFRGPARKPAPCPRRLRAEAPHQLFAEMQTGTDFSVILNKKLLHFNGGLFAEPACSPSTAPSSAPDQSRPRMQWADVEPAIFGTLLERALDPEERHKLGAHFTPRAYVERLVLPTVIEPLRAEWEAVRAAALATRERPAQEPAPRSTPSTANSAPCVLDPACGSGNFLYVTLEHLKRLEGEVLDVAAGFGENLKLELATHSVDPHQFLGLEINPRAAAIAELVLWIGYLQWHFRTRGKPCPPSLC